MVCVTLPTRWTRLWVWMFKGCCVCCSLYVSTDHRASHIGEVVGGSIGFIIMIFVLIACVITILKTKCSTRRSQQITIPQPSVVRCSTYPSISQQAPQPSTGGETTVTSSAPQHAENTGHASVGPAVNTNSSPSDYPYPPPPYNLTYCKDDESTTDNQPSRHGGVSSIPPPSYSSVVSTVPVPPSTNI